MTETISATAARDRLFKIVEEVNADHTVKRITSKKGDAVIMSADDWEGWQETAYLMRSPANHERLLEAMDDVRQGRHLVTPTPEELAEMRKAAE